MTGTHDVNPAWGRSTQLSPSSCHVLIVIVLVSLCPTDSEERTLSLLWPRRMIGQSRSPTPWTKPLSSWIRVLAGVGRLLPLHPRITVWFPHPVSPPDGGDRDGARCRPGPAAGPSFRHHGSAVDRQELPEIIEKAAAWRGLLVPPAQESSLAGGRSVSPGYRPSGVTWSGRASRPSGSTRREWRRPLGA